MTSSRACTRFSATTSTARTCRALRCWGRRRAQRCRLHRRHERRGDRRAACCGSRRCTAVSSRWRHTGRQHLEALVCPDGRVSAVSTRAPSVRLPRQRQHRLTLAAITATHMSRRAGRCASTGVALEVTDIAQPPRRSGAARRACGTSSWRRSANTPRGRPRATKAGRDEPGWKQTFLVLTFCRTLHSLARRSRRFEARRRASGRLDLARPTLARLIAACARRSRDPWGARQAGSEPSSSNERSRSPIRRSRSRLGDGAAEALGRAGLALRRLDLAVARRSGGDELGKQTLGRDPRRRRSPPRMLPRWRARASACRLPCARTAATRRGSRPRSWVGSKL